ncbi:ParA family partition ATPase [Craurococcus roseus]|uniref:ParA family partition ATPase n=1 Tax=Craurococcus roseus TaxID=77585 RepID=A0ABN1EZD1_9PROT
MAFVVAVAQQKGGSGKSTVAVNLAAVLAAEGRRVGLLDTDPQGSVTRWHEERQRRADGLASLSFAHPSGWRVPTALDKLRRSHDVVVLDTPPHAGTDAKVAIRAADLVLMPVQPSPADLWASEGTRRLAAEEKRLLRALLNRVPAQGKMRDRVAAALKEMEVPLLEQCLGNRAHFASAFLDGLAVTEAAPRSAAAAEARALAEAVIALSSSFPRR